MNTVGRIFIVVNLVLTFILVGFVGAFQYSAVGYRKPYEALKVNGEQQLTTMRQRAEGAENASAQLAKENEILRNDNAKLAARLGTVYSTLVAETTAQKTIEESWTAVKERLDEWQSIYQAMETATQNYNNEVNELRQQQTELAEATRLARNREVTAASFRVRADNLTKALMEQNRELQNAKQRLEQTLSVYVSMHGELGDVGPAPGLTGTVTSVSESGSLLAVRLDTGATGIEPMIGWTFALVSDRDLKGFVRVSEVTGTGDVYCRVLSLREGASEPAPGDRVTSFN